MHSSLCMQDDRELGSDKLDQFHSKHMQPQLVGSQETHALVNRVSRSGRRCLQMVSTSCFCHSALLQLLLHL